MSGSGLFSDLLVVAEVEANVQRVALARAELLAAARHAMSAFIA
ncbi:hypothetical protein [Streptomyces sp. IGB124]|nr:hypothetical protein [Streptomyces sp. IGB124]